MQIPLQEIQRRAVSRANAFWLLLFILFSGQLARTGAAIPETVAFQGTVAVNGEPFTGTGQFMFILAESNEAFLFLDPLNGPPRTPTLLPVNQGQYTVRFGVDTVRLPVEALAERKAVVIQVWFSDGTAPFQRLTPDYPLDSVAFARQSHTAFYATKAEFAIDAFRAESVSGPVSASQITGVIGESQLPISVARLDSSPVFSGVVQAGQFRGRGAFLWVSASDAEVPLVLNTGYLAERTREDGPVTFALPPTGLEGDVIRIVGAGTGGWQVKRSDGQYASRETPRSQGESAEFHFTSKGEWQIVEAPALDALGLIHPDRIPSIGAAKIAGVLTEQQLPPALFENLNQLEQHVSTLAEAHSNQVSAPVPASRITGVIGESQLPTSVARLDSSPVFSGMVQAGQFRGRGALPWVSASDAEVPLALNTGYLAERTREAGPVTFILPSIGLEGDVIRIVGAGTGGWQIKRSDGQYASRETPRSQGESAEFHFTSKGEWQIVEAPALDALGLIHPDRIPSIGAAKIAGVLTEQQLPPALFENLNQLEQHVSTLAEAHSNMVSAPVPASRITGVIGESQLPTSVARLDSSPVFSGMVQAGQFRGRGALPWVSASDAEVPLVLNTGYLAERTREAGPVTFILPSTGLEGDVIRIVGAGTGGWQVKRSDGQYVSRETPRSQGESAEFHFTSEGEWQIMESPALDALGLIHPDRIPSIGAAKIAGALTEQQIPQTLLARLSSLEQYVSTLTAANVTQESTLRSQQLEIDTLRSETAAMKILLSETAAMKDLLAEATNKLAHFSRNGNEVYITGANVFIRNGKGNTLTPDGLGNLTIGYNKVRGGGADVRTGSHNLILGDMNNYSSSGGFIAGLNNKIEGAYASVLGGRYNLASGLYSTISGGNLSTASGEYSSVSGGWKNIASRDFSSVSGGYQNTASGEISSISGGADNTASGERSSISGGRLNTASAYCSIISGGYQNAASGSYSIVSGGWKNIASGVCSSVSGGQGIKATSNYSILP